jgi:hypothetical protein
MYVYAPEILGRHTWNFSKNRSIRNFKFKNDGSPLPYAVKILEHVKSYDWFYIPIMGPKGDPFFIGKVGDFMRTAMSTFLVKTSVLDHLVIPKEETWAVPILCMSGNSPA